MANSRSSLMRKMRKSLDSGKTSTLCCIPRCMCRNDAEGSEDFQFQEVDDNFQASYVPVDPRDIENLSSLSLTSSSENSPSREAQNASFRRFLTRLRLTGRKPRSSSVSCFQSFGSSLNMRGGGNKSKNKAKKIKLPVSAERLQRRDSNSGMDYVKIELTILQNDDNRMKLALPDDFIGITDNMATDLDTLLIQEEEERIRKILIDDYIDSDDIYNMSDDIKARRTDELFQRLDKVEQHAVRHHSYILVHDILSKL